MALPPVVTNSPLFKILTGSPAHPSGVKEAASPKGQGHQDTVTLSEEALRKLGESNAGSIRTENDARETAAGVRADLEKNPGLTLGGDTIAL